VRHALPGETVRVQVTFSDHPGLYLYHCHILEHEDMGMMRNFRIRA
jgi:FtsP/CotA-like multicopper oxidase with cupredoxin domain